MSITSAVTMTHGNPAAAAAAAGAGAGAANAVIRVPNKRVGADTDASMGAFFKAFEQASRGDPKPIELWNAALRKKVTAPQIPAAGAGVAKSPEEENAQAIMLSKYAYEHLLRQKNA